MLLAKKKYRDRIVNMKVLLIGIVHLPPMKKSVFLRSICKDASTFYCFGPMI